MTVLNVEFSYEIGERVFIRTASHRDGLVPRQFLITERVARQCSGGVQLFYTLFDVDDEVPEIALTRNMPEYLPLSEGAIQDIRRSSEARREVGWGGIGWGVPGRTFGKTWVPDRDPEISPADPGIQPCGTDAAKP